MVLKRAGVGAGRQLNPRIPVGACLMWSHDTDKLHMELYIWLRQTLGWGFLYLSVYTRGK